MNASHVKTVLVTGGTGFIGSHLVRSLVRDGYRVHVLARPSSDTSRIRDILPKITVHSIALSDRTGLTELMGAIRPAGVIHLAASNIVSGKVAGAHELITTNLEGAVNLIDAADAIKYDFFIMAGTFLEYGLHVTHLMEDIPSVPNDLYSITKLGATLYGRAVAHAKRKPIITFRFFTPYGPQVQEGRLMHELIKRAHAGEDLLLTAPSVTRDFIYIDDLIALLREGMIRAKDSGGEIFNAGTGTATTFGELVPLILFATKSCSTPRWGSFPPVPYDTARWQADTQKTFARFSWRPQTSLVDGIAKTVEWFTMAEH